MLRNLFSPRIRVLSLEDALELANEHLDNARKERDPENSLELTNNAESLLKDAEHIFASKKVKDPALSENIANAYRKHGRLLDDLRHHDKAKKSHCKAKKWGYVDVISRHAGSPHPFCKSDAIHRSLLPTTALSVASNVAAVMYQDSFKTDVTQLNYQDHTPHPIPAKVYNGKPTPNRDNMHIPQKIFDRNTIPSITKYTLPEPNGLIISTLQLAYCLSLLHPSMISKEELDQNESDWLQDKFDDSGERKRLQSMATDLIRVFVRDELKTPSVIAEVVSLTGVLGQSDLRKLFQAFVDGIDQSLLLDTNLLDGLAQLIRNAPQGYIGADDLVEVLELLDARLEDTHKQSTQHTYQLALTISQLLDSMVDSQAEELSLEQLHKPLSNYLKRLQQNSDPYLIYQAAYTYQALHYILDDKTILQFTKRRTGKVVQGISEAVKALDLIGFIEGLRNVQQGLAGAEKTIRLVSHACSNAVAQAQNGQGLLASLKEWLNFKHKSSWYPALRGLDRLVQEGRFADFEKLVREAPCQHDPIFRWGVCQRLGEIAANPIWDLNTRRCAVDFLTQLYKGDASKSQQVDIKHWMLYIFNFGGFPSQLHKDDVNENQQVDIKQWVLYILNQLAESSKEIIDGSTQELLQEVQANGSISKGVLYHGCENDDLVLHLRVTTPASMESPLLDRVQRKTDVETPLHQLRLERLKDWSGDVYISPRAKATQRVTDDFDLTSKVQEFLTSDGKVFLVLGDSGAGKSTFNRALEINLWDNYKTNGRIPLFIYLPAIENPERDLITEILRRANFTESQILELKLYHEFILICDGYDEIQQTRNLYMSNQLNQPGQWRAQMVISCRREYIGVDYKDFFQPNGRNSGRDTRQFQEAIMSPFTKKQTQDYIEQYVLLQKPPWKLQDYLQALEQIPNLQDLVKNPFLLKVSLDVLPRLLKTNTKLSSTYITRSQLYDEFVAQWIDRGKMRLGEMRLNPHDRETFNRMKESGFQRHGFTYLKELVTAIYENQDDNPVVRYSSHLDRRTWKEAFFSDRDGRRLLREVIPLTRNGDQYRFIHKSLMEYGLSLAIFDPSKFNKSTEAALHTEATYRRRSTSSVLSFESPSLTEGAGTADDKSLLDSPLGERNLIAEQSILRSWAERIRQEYRFFHKSLLENGLFLAVFGPSKRNEDAEAMPSVSRRGSTSSVLSFENPSSTENRTTADDQSLLDSPLGKRNLVEERSILHFLTERVQQEPVFRVRLHSLIERSKTDKTARTAAANAITILVRVGVQFNGADLRNIKVPGADLSFGMFDSAQLGEADLRKANLRGVWMRQANLRGAQVQGVQFGELPFLQEDSEVGCSAFSLNGKTYAAGLRDGNINLYDTLGWNRIQRLEGHSDRVNIISFSPTGSWIASGSRDSTVRVWDVDTGECVHILQGHFRAVNSVVHSPKGDRIASGSRDSTVRVWDVDTGECVHTLQGHSWTVNSVVYSPKGDRIASGSSDCTLRLWDVDTGECVHILQGHSGDINSVVYTPRGDQIASGSSDCTLRLWDVGTGECVYTMQGHTWVINNVVYSPKGDRIASGSWDSTVRVWDVDTGECIHTLKGHSWIINCVVYSPKGDRIASGSEDGTARLWDVDTGECVHILQGHSGDINSVVYTPRGDQIASGSSDHTVRLWDVDTGECVQASQDGSWIANSVVYSPKGDRIASGGSDSTVRLLDVDSGECVHTLQGHSWTVNSVVYSPKGDRIASGSSDCTLQLWDADTGECIHTLMGHVRGVNSVAYSPKGDRIASGSSDCTLRLWNVDTGECIHALRGHVRGVSSVVYSPKGDQIASGGLDSTVRLWDVESGKCAHILQDHNHNVNSVVYSPKGDRIASGSNDSTVRLWDVDTGECVHTLQGHSGDVSSVVYTPKGDRIASGSHDRTVRLWDVESGQCLATISGFNSGVSSIALEGSFDTQYLVTGSRDKSIRRWRITKEGAEYKVVLCWSSSHEILTVNGLSFEDVQGLSRRNRELLIQRGAFAPNLLAL